MITFVARIAVFAAKSVVYKPLLVKYNLFIHLLLPIVSEFYESLNVNLRLVLLTRVSMNFYHTNASTGNRGSPILLTVRMYFEDLVN